jgi:hypothetical protein
VGLQGKGTLKCRSVERKDQSAVVHKINLEKSTVIKR